MKTTSQGQGLGPLYKKFSIIKPGERFIVDDRLLMKLESDVQFITSAVDLKTGRVILIDQNKLVRVSKGD